jgi:hypothetical protein
MIEELSKEHAVRELCELLEVTRSGYYAWSRGQQSARELANGLVVEQIKRVFQAKRRRYGSPRITEELRREGQVCNHKRVERLMPGRAQSAQRQASGGAQDQQRSRPTGRAEPVIGATGAG